MSGRSSRRMFHGGGGGSASGSLSDLRVKGNKDQTVDKEEKMDGKGKSEEVRISKLTRLLARMDTEESFMTICGQIEGALNEVDNQKYVYRFFACLCPSFLDVFKGLSGLTWEAAGIKRYAQLLSNICKAMENQRVKFFQWIVEIIMRTAKGSQTHVSSSAYVMEAVSIHLLNKLDLGDIIKFVTCVYDVLEDVSNPKVFRVLGVIFVCGTSHSAASWRNPHFQDFIDMVVGWMVDVRQSQGQFDNCAELLDQSRPQFENDISFLITLLSQLLEDLEQAIKKVQPISDSSSDEFKKVLQLLKAFTSLLGLECTLDKSVLNEFCDRMVVSTLQFIRMCEPHQSMDRRYRYELLLTVNKAVFYSGGYLSQSTIKYFRAQLKLATTNSGFIGWPKLFLVGFLESITVWVESAVSQTQLTDDIMEICGSLLSMMEDMRTVFPTQDQYNVLNLVITLLRSRNVALLQKVYEWLISKLPSMEDGYSDQNNESVLFVLAGLADIISNKSSSILSLWALQPAIFELLVKITNMKLHRRTLHSAMELLRTHCNMHSHFVSAIASTGSFASDSPGTKFLPALMDFWLEKAKTLPIRESRWLIDWIFEFLQGSNSYASILFELKQDFYYEFLKIITQTTALVPLGAKIMDWLSRDQEYSQLESMKYLISERLLILVLDEKLSEQTKILYKRVLYEMQTMLVVPEIVFIEDCKDMGLLIHDDNQRAPEIYSSTSLEALVPTEFNLFLYELLVGNSPDIPKLGSFGLKNVSTSRLSADNKLLSLAADHLIRLKLKTLVGKPQDFFMQLCILLKKSRTLKTPVPTWKLHFVFELEKKFQLWTSGSAIDETELTEHVRQFYLMNKTPFLEWLKRIRIEIIESSLLSKDYALAYLNAALMGDCPKMEYALFRMNDHFGLKGMGNMAADLFLEGKYEEVMKLVKNQDDNSNELSNDIQDKSKVILADCLSILGKWPDDQDLKSSNSSTTKTINTSFLFDPQHIDLTDLLDFQLKSNSKTDFSVIGNCQDLLENLKLPALQKIHCWLTKLPEHITSSISEAKLEKLERIRMDKMIEAGNINYVASWLQKKDLDINSIQTDEDLSNFSFTSVPVSTLKVCADYYFAKGEYRKSGILYNVLRELVAGSMMDADLANKVTLHLCKQIGESDDFFNAFASESLSDCDRLEIIKSLHQVAAQCFPEEAKIWLTYGDFTYDQLQQRSKSTFEEPMEAEVMKYSVVECYVKYIQLSTCKEQEISSNGIFAKQQSIISKSLFLPYTPKLIVMARLLQLFREGAQFDVAEIIKTDDWLLLAAEIAQIPEMRSYLIERFPEQTSLLLSSHDSTKVKHKFTVKRKHLLDLAPFSYVDTSEEPLNSNVILNNLSQLEKTCSSPIPDASDSQFHYRSQLNIPPCASMFAQELLTLANSMEDMWVWSLERIDLDWSRRLTYLKKECTRSLSHERIQAYIQPVITYLEALLSTTHDSLSPIDVNFLNRHKSVIRRQLDLLSSSNTLEEVCTAMNTLMQYSDRFGLLVNNKLPVSVFSPKLADVEFFQGSNFSICLPGLSSQLKVSGIYPVVHSLPTKTKPKRIKLLANNGKFYDYLVKGSENLNIDCGVMQFLKVVQSFFQLPTRTYSVTPLGKRGGLIQIVPDAVPLFSLYKKHLQRNNTMEKTSKMFWDKMNALGYDDRSSAAAQREVFESLHEETSGDLITRELLLAADTPLQWVRSVKTFTTDCAVGSAVGYLLGIGDRHLDNILLNSKHGKFIHVDFSILFGKGATLRVPERVPFRMTQNVQSVLQYPGPSGTFSNVIQDVLSSFQMYKSTSKHLVKNISFCHSYDDDPPVDLTQILLSEIEAAIKLFQSRSSQYLSTLQVLRNDTVCITDDIDLNYKIPRRMNRWRRMLVNLNTSLQFLVGILLPNGPYENVITLIKHQWAEVFQSSLEVAMEQRIPSCTLFLDSMDKTERILKELQARLAECNNWELEMLKLQNSNIQIVDWDKIGVLTSYVEVNVQTFNSASTVRKLIDEATSVDNLAQMYEGWTAWV